MIYIAIKVLRHVYKGLNVFIWQYFHNFYIFYQHKEERSTVSSFTQNIHVRFKAVSAKNKVQCWTDQSNHVFRDSIVIGEISFNGTRTGDRSDGILHGTRGPK